MAECDINLDNLGIIGFLPGCDPGDHGGDGGGGGGDREIEIEINTDDFGDTDGSEDVVLLADQRLPTPFLDPLYETHKHCRPFIFYYA